MQTFDQSIFSLFQNEQISYDEALRWATNVDEFKLKVQGISTTADTSRDQMANTIFSNQNPKPAAARPAQPAKPGQPAKPAVVPPKPEITRFRS